MYGVNKNSFKLLYITFLSYSAYPPTFVLIVILPTSFILGQAQPEFKYFEAVRMGIYK